MSGDSSVFKICVLAPFAPVPEQNFALSFTEVPDKDLDSSAGSIAPVISVPVDKELCPDGNLAISISAVKSFRPDEIIKNNPFLKNLFDAKNHILDSIKNGVSDDEIYEKISGWADLPIKINYSPGQKSPAKAAGAVDDILNMVVAEAKSPPGGSGEPKSWVVQIENHITRLMTLIFSDDNFKSCEASWRGAELLMKQGMIKGGSKLSLAPVSMHTLAEAIKDIKMRFIDDPPSIIVVDLDFDASPHSFEVLASLAELGETILVPVVTNINAKFMRLDNWGEQKSLPYIKHHIEDASFAKWRKLMESSSGAWLTVMCNCFLSRYRYGKDNPARMVGFEEPQELWINPSWALLTMLSKRVSDSGWPTRFTETGSSRVADLALSGECGEDRTTTETVFNTDRISQFVEAGIMPLASEPNRDLAFLPKEGTVSAGSLEFQFLLSKIIGLVLWTKDNTGDMSGAEIESTLTNVFSKMWLDTGHDPPSDLGVSVDESDPSQPPIVTISMTPPRQVISKGQKIQFSLGWQAAIALI
jgi:type VI secretion system protein ImpC